MDPRRQGQFVHAVFEDFFRAWQDSGPRCDYAGQPGRRAAHVRDDRRSAARGVDVLGRRSGPRADAAARLAGRGRAGRSGLPDGSRASGCRRRATARVQRQRRADGRSRPRVRGPSPCAARPIGSTFSTTARSASSTTSSAGRPIVARALQLPMYALFAEQRLQNHRGRRYVLGEAAYLAFKGPRRVVPLFTSPAQRDDVMSKAQERLSTRSTRSAAANSRRRPTTSIGARRAASPRSAGRTMWTADEAARRDAVDPSRNVVLEASAGTGKTRVLVERYVNLLRAGVEPEHILAITFTRKAAAEMRERIIDRLREASRTSEIDRARWRELKERLGDIAISTIDAFCLSLLREFPLEADVDPGFDLAARHRGAAAGRRVADPGASHLPRPREGRRRRRARVRAARRAPSPHRPGGVDRSPARRARRAAPLPGRVGPRQLTAEVSLSRGGRPFPATLLTGVRGGLDAFLRDGPIHDPQFAMLAGDIRRLADPPALPARHQARAGGLACG